jgi:hypothetical protein
MRLQGKQHTTTRNGFSPRNLPRSLPTDPHSPHACFTPGVYTFSVTWIVLWLIIFLALGYRNRLDWKSLGSMAATRFLPEVLSFLCALSLLERVTHRSNNMFFQLQPPLSPGESIVQTGQQATWDQTLHIHHNPRESIHEHPRAVPDRCNSITRLSSDETLMFSQFGNTK